MKENFQDKQRKFYNSRRMLNARTENEPLKFAILMQYLKRL